MSTSYNHLSVSDLRKAANLKERIEALEKELSRLIGSAPSAASSTDSAPRKKRGMSAAGRARIIAAQKARWAKVHAAKGGAKPAKKKKRGMSAAGRARIIAAQKARWAKVRAAKAGK
jgi:hypothetical protein